MSALHLNDPLGQYPKSWYAHTAQPLPPQLPLSGCARVDVCIIGAGITGLSAAKHLAQKGLNVAVLEAHRIGFGASGRNGGQVGSGFNLSQQALKKRLGKENAASLWALGEEAKGDLRALCERYPDIGYASGVAHGCLSQGETRDEHEDAEFLQNEYGYDQIEPLDQDQLYQFVKSKTYKGGSIDWGAGHVHPLRYTFALAKDALQHGATVYELSEALSVEDGPTPKIKTASGEITANHVIFAGNGYLPNLHQKLSNHVMPINSFIGVTEPLTEEQAVLAQNIAVADSRFVVNYYRMTEDHRFLFGGRENYTLKFPRDIQTALYNRMIDLFPQLTGVPYDFVWGGTLGITMKRVPFIQQLSQNMLAVSGFSGHGVALAGLSGKVAAEAVAGQAGRFDVLSKLPHMPFPGGSYTRAPLLALAMTWYALRDRLGV